MWKDFFYYTRGEQRGVVVVLFLIAVVFLIRITLPYWSVQKDLTEEEKLFVAQIQAVNDSINHTKSLFIKDSLFSFNPNEVTAEELNKLGFSKYQQSAFLAYREKLGSFKNINQIHKVYGLDSAFVHKLADSIIWDLKPKAISTANTTAVSVEPIVWIDFNKEDTAFYEQYIVSSVVKDSVLKILDDYTIVKSLPLSKVKSYSDEQILAWLRNNRKQKYKRVQKNVPNDFIIELNAADTLELKQLRGIGSVLSNRIVKYRNSLGGFYTVEQLKEVYGISDGVFEQIKEHVTVDIAGLKKFSIDKDSISVMSRHPYFKYKQVIVLVNHYRKEKSLRKSDVLNLQVISAEEWEKMRHYLTINEE
jgi:competence ComEA-like helix-hairpin-helix protein